jgi:pimeloyl-ACP methyl ester carboxylesterase
VSTAAAMTPGWSRAFRPLGRGTIAAQLAVLVAVEALLFASYRGAEADFHWATHFLVGLTAAAVVLAGWLAVKGAPARGQLMCVLGLHLFAMFPDLLFRPGHQPHDDWMDVFLGHIAVHYMPGGALTWLVVALAASGAYAWMLSRWLAARRAEVDAGMPPGVGISGGAVLRPQASPVERTLAHETFGPPAEPQVVLLHGLGASREVWRSVMEDVEQRGVSGLAVDLLGFGRSRTIGTRFGLTEHVAALAVLVGRVERPVTVVGHSFGCAVAVRLARKHPHDVARLVLVSPPAFRDADSARTRLGRRGWLARRVLDDAPAASITCGLMCVARPLAARLLARVARTVPARVARDGVEHSWPAYRDALMALLNDNPLPDALSDPPAPTVVVVGDHDEQAPPADVLDWPHDRVEVREVAADHLLPLSHAGVVADAITRGASY